MPELQITGNDIGPHVGKVTVNGHPYSLSEIAEIQHRLAAAINTAQMYVTEVEDVRDATLQEDVFSSSLAGIVLMNLASGQWEGTFSNSVAKLMSDLAADHSPVEVRLYFHMQAGSGLRKVSGWINGYDSATATFTFVDGSTQDAGEGELMALIIPA